MNLRRRTGSHGRGGARLAYRTPIAASLATACLLGSVLGAQPAAAQSIFDRENHAAAASYAVHHLGADPKYGNWESGVNTYTAVGASAANRYARLPADRALPATIANKWTAMADFVTQVTGYNPRVSIQGSFDVRVDTLSRKVAGDSATRAPIVLCLQGFLRE